MLFQSATGPKSIELPPPSAARVLRRRNTTIDRRIPIEVNNDDDDGGVDPGEVADRTRPSRQPQRIARRRDTFCEVIDTPEKGDGSRAIKIKITTNKSKQSVGDATIEAAPVVGKRSSSADTSASERNAKKPKTKGGSPPEITGRPVLSRECKVVLEKLDGAGLKRARYDMADSSEEEEQEEHGKKGSNAAAGAAANKSSTKTPTAMEAKRLKRIYNTDKLMHSRTEPTSCALCSATPRFLVRHYVNEHEGYEVCHARMPPETTDMLRDGAEGMSEGVHENNKISALCHYCEKMRSFGIKDWVMHITRHTGEYMRRCNKCDLKCADNKFTASLQCAHDDVGIWNDIEVKGDALGVYVCSQCNYSQLLEANLQKHWRQMHSDIKDIENQYAFVELISNVRKKRARRAPAAATAASATVDNASETSSSVSEAEPVNTNVFEPSEQGDGLFDTETLQLMKETTFKESIDDAPGSNQGTAKNMMVDKLSERFRKQDAIRHPTPEMDDIDVAMECPEESTSTVVGRRPNKPTNASRKGTQQILNSFHFGCRFYTKNKIYFFQLPPPPPPLSLMQALKSNQMRTPCRMDGRVARAPKIMKTTTDHWRTRTVRKTKRFRAR